MLFDRQKRLLALLNALGGDVGNLDFQKLLFLYCRKIAPAQPYEFVPYRFGGFSFTSYADRRKLIEQGMLANDDDAWVLTPDGRAAAATADAPTRRTAARFAHETRDLRGHALVTEAYRLHPYYAIHSEMAARLFANEPAALAAIDKARPAKGIPGLFTIGYEGHSLESYLNILIRNSVTLLCDVRRNPISRKYGFSKNTLAKGCDGVGIRYEHRPELGIASDERRELRDQSDYDALFVRYRRETLPLQAAALDEIHGWMARGHRVALTCFEHLPEQCHRHCVARAVQEKLTTGFATAHL